MTDERYDIIITDGVDPGVSKSILAIAAAADKGYSSVSKLRKQLDSLNITSLIQLSNAQSKATVALAKNTTAESKATIAKARANTELAKQAMLAQRAATELERTAAAQAVSNARTTQAQLATVKLETATTKLAAAKSREAVAQNAANAAQSLNNKLKQSGAGLSRLQFQQAQNLSYQLQDIGVSLASGQRPLTVLFQQGSQIYGIFGPGKGLLGIFKEMGVLLATIFAPLAVPLAIVGSLALGVQLLRKEINGTRKDGVSFGDTFKAIFQVIGGYIYDVIGPGFEYIRDIGTSVLSTLAREAKNAANLFIGAFIGLGSAVTVGIAYLPGAIYDIFATAFNKVIDLIQNLVNRIQRLIKPITDLGNEAAAYLGFGQVFADNVQVDLQNAKIALTGDAAALGTETAAAYFGAQRDYVGKYGGILKQDIADQAEKNRTKRLNEEDGGTKYSYADAKKELEDEIALLKVYGNERKALKVVLETEQRLKKQLSAEQKAELMGLENLRQVLQAQSDILDRNQESLLEYNTTVAAANQLYKDGAINANQYNLAIANTKLVQDGNALKKQFTGIFGDQGGIAEIQTQAEEWLAVANDMRSSNLVSLQEYADLEVAIETEKNRQITNLQLAKYDMAFGYAEEGFGSLVELAEAYAGKESGIYKTMFATQKAFALAKAVTNTYLAVSNALATLPPPANFAAAFAAGAAGAAQVANITKSVIGLKDGGIVDGLGGARADMNLRALSTGEFVVNAAATARHRPVLEAINDNRAIPSSGAVNTGGKGVVVNIQNYGTSKNFEVQQLSPDQVRIIARDEAKKSVAKDAPQVIANNLSNPNSPVSKSITKNTSATRKRGG